MKNNLRDKKGFTLVELIVVITILGILIALTLPALSGYLKMQKERDAIQECRQAVLAAQQLYDSLIARNAPLPQNEIDLEEAVTLAGVNGTITAVDFGLSTTLKIEQLDYTSASGIHISYRAGADKHYTVVSGG